MKRLICGLVLMLASICVGCGNDDYGGQGEGSGAASRPEEHRITFTTAIAPTRAPQLEADGSGSFSAGDIFTLYAHDDAQGSATIDYGIGSTTLYWSDLAFASAGSSIHFEACYPRQTLLNGGFDFTTTQDSAGDLLWASVSDVSVGSEGSVLLTFRHALHRLVVKYTIQDSFVDASQIETRCTACATARVELSEGRIMLDGGKQTYAAKNKEVSFLLLPQPVNEVTLEVCAGDASRTWNLSEMDFSYPELEGGKQVTMNLTIADGAIRIEGISIEGWGDQGAVEDEIIL